MCETKAGIVHTRDRVSAPRRYKILDEFSAMRELETE